MRAASGGTLQIETEVTQDPNTGLIIAENGGIVKLNSSNSRVNEGRLQSIGTGVFQAENNAQLWDVHNQATIEVAADDRPGKHVHRRLRADQRRHDNRQPGHARRHPFGYRFAATRK